MGRRIAGAAAAVAALWSAPGWAHTSGRTLELPAPIAPPTATGPDVLTVVLTAAAFAAIALAMAQARRRTMLGAALIVLTLWMGFEASAHSVHHLGQPSEESRCAVASVTAHSAAIPSDVNVCASLLLPQITIAGGLEPRAHGNGLPAAHEGRAPPRLSP